MVDERLFGMFPFRMFLINLMLSAFILPIAEVVKIDIFYLFNLWSGQLQVSRVNTEQIWHINQRYTNTDSDSHKCPPMAVESWTLLVCYHFLLSLSHPIIIWTQGISCQYVLAIHAFEQLQICHIFCDIGDVNITYYFRSIATTGPGGLESECPSSLLLQICCQFAGGSDFPKTYFVYLSFRHGFVTFKTGLIRTLWLMSSKMFQINYFLFVTN